MEPLAPTNPLATSQFGTLGTLGRVQADSWIAPPTPPPPKHIDTFGGQTSTKPSTSQQSFQRLPRINTIAVLDQHRLSLSPDSSVLEIWEGVVLEVDMEARVMQVSLDAKMSQIPSHAGEISLEWVADQDMDLVRIGSVFYLTLFKQTRRGTIQNSQELRFRRRPAWSRHQIEEISREAALLSKKARTRPICA